MCIRGCALIQAANKMLVLVYDYPGGRVHALPGGGVQENELLSEAVVRECREELGIDVTIQGLRYVGDMPAQAHIGQTLHVVFDAELIAGEPKIDPSQTSALSCTWLPLADVGQYRLYPAISQALLEDLESRDGHSGGRYLGNCLTREWV